MCEMQKSIHYFFVIKQIEEVAVFVRCSREEHGGVLVRIAIFFVFVAFDPELVLDVETGFHFDCV